MAIVPLLISTTMLNYFNFGGLIEEMNLIFILNMIIPNLVDFIIDPDIWVRKIKIYFLEKFMKTNKGMIFNQKQANDAVKGLDFNISDPYSYTFSTMAAAFFYFPIFPLGMVYGLISIAIAYWVNKVKKFFNFFLSTLLHKDVVKLFNSPLIFQEDLPKILSSVSFSLQ